jgi:hypothetical protein
LHFGGKEWQGTVNQLGVGTAILIAGVFILAFFVVWFILYIGSMKETEDIYSQIRHKIEGSWVVEYDYTVNGQKLFPAKPVGTLQFIVNSEKKLEIAFDLRDNRTFSDKSPNVKNISLCQGEGRKVFLSYYHKNERTLTEDIARHIEAEYADQDKTKLQTEVFGVVSFDDTAGDQKILDMAGEWFDLNGNLKLLGLMYKGKFEADAGGQPFETKLSALPLGRSLSAKMGTISFRRQT